MTYIIVTTDNTMVLRRNKKGYEQFSKSLATAIIHTNLEDALSDLEFASQMSGMSADKVKLVSLEPVE